MFCRISGNSIAGEKLRSKPNYMEDLILPSGETNLSYVSEILSLGLTVEVNDITYSPEAAGPYCAVSFESEDEFY